MEVEVDVCCFCGSSSGELYFPEEYDSTKRGHNAVPLRDMLSELNTDQEGQEGSMCIPCIHHIEESYNFSTQSNCDPNSKPVLTLSADSTEFGANADPLAISTAPCEHSFSKKKLRIEAKPDDSPGVIAMSANKLTVTSKEMLGNSCNAAPNDSQDTASEPLGSRRRVSYRQLQALWEAVDSHRDISLGYNKSCEARELSRRMWQRVARTLNCHGDGAVKDWKGWCKYWIDYKSKLKKAAVTRRIKRTGAGAFAAKSFTDLERKFIEMMEQHSSGSPGVRAEPSEEETQSEHPRLSRGLPPPPVPPRRTTVVQFSKRSPVHGPPPLATTLHKPPPEVATTLRTPPPPPATIVNTTPPLAITVHKSSHPLRRIILKRVPPLATIVRSPPPPPARPPAPCPRSPPPLRRAQSAQARSRRRLQLEERNSATLRELADDIKEIKEILRRFQSLHHGPRMLDKCFWSRSGGDKVFSVRTDTPRDAGPGVQADVVRGVGCGGGETQAVWTWTNYHTGHVMLDKTYEITVNHFLRGSGGVIYCCFSSAYSVVTV